MPKILIVNSYPDTAKASTADVVIEVGKDTACVIKDRQCLAFGAVFLSDKLNEFISAVFSGYEIEDCRV